MKEKINGEEWIKHMNSLPKTVLEEGQEDPTIVKLQPGETLEDYMKRNNLVNGDEIIAQMKAICDSYRNIYPLRKISKRNG